MNAKLSVLAALAVLACSSSFIACDQEAQQAAQESRNSARLESLKQRIKNMSTAYPNLFDPKDVEAFIHEEGSLGASRFLNQRSQNLRRALGLAQSVLKWRKNLGLSELDASSFPCDLFKMGLIFESGRAHALQASGEFTETNPVIWIRLGALGSIVKQLERLTPNRLISAAYNSPRNSIHRAYNKIRASRQRRLKQLRADRLGTKIKLERKRLIKSMSARDNKTLTHVLSAIAWWLENWVNTHPRDAQATLVLDFENSDFAFASWSAGEFFVKLDDMFPSLFDRIIGFRYKAKLWSLHSPISMFNRIFKSRFSSSPETDRKLMFVNKEPQIGVFMPRVDAGGFTMLPEHVSGACLGPDESKAPPGCSDSNSGDKTAGLYDPNLWQAILNEFYNTCVPKPRQV